MLPSSHHHKDERKKGVGKTTMAYRNILQKLTKEYNFAYQFIRKHRPSVSVKEKQDSAFYLMAKARKLDLDYLATVIVDPLQDPTKFQYCCEIIAIKEDVERGINRFYIKDDSLFDFFKNTDIKKKEVDSILKSKLVNVDSNIILGVIGQQYSFTMLITTSMGNHIVTILSDEMNYTFVAEHIDKADGKWVFNMAMNFLFYINAFPECVIDGVPNGVKKDSKAKVISTSEKIVSHTSVEHGFVRPHFRSGYFRHLNSDYFVNCKGQVRFIASTMVKGKAKTVLSRQGV